MTSIQPLSFSEYCFNYLLAHPVELATLTMIEENSPSIESHRGEMFNNSSLNTICESLSSQPSMEQQNAYKRRRIGLKPVLLTNTVTQEKIVCRSRNKAAQIIGISQPTVTRILDKKCVSPCYRYNSVTHIGYEIESCISKSNDKKIQVESLIIGSPSEWNPKILKNLIEFGKYVLYGGNKLSKQYSTWVQKKQEGEIKPIQTNKCECGRQIRKNFYVKNTENEQIIVVGFCCIKQVQFYKPCDRCGSHHYSKLNNLCCTCRKILQSKSVHTKGDGLY